MSKTHIAAGCIALLVGASASAELRTYDVDFKYQQEVYQALHNILAIDPEIAAAAGLTYGRVQLLPTGQIVVDTSAATHAEIEELLLEIKARQAAPTPRVRFRYWVVLGSGAAQATDGTPPILSDVLDELRRVHGDLSFRVIGTATLVTESGQQGEIASEPLRAEQRVYVQGQTASAEIELRYIEPRQLDPAAAQAAFATIPPPYVGQIDLNVTLERGEFLVLGENTVRSPPLDGTIFFIAHWPENE